MTNGNLICGTNINKNNKGEIKYKSVMLNSHKSETIKAKDAKGATKHQPNAVRSDTGEKELHLY